MRTFDAGSADAAWRLAAEAVMARRGTHQIGSRAGDTVELLHAIIAIDDPRARWVASRVPAMNIALAIAEVVQILTGAGDVAFLEHWFPGYGRYVGGGTQAYGAYGVRLRDRWGVDQLDRAARALVANSETRQAVLTIWDPRLDLPCQDGLPRSGDVPCNLMSCLRLAEGKLYWFQTCRSNDLFRGLPYNLVQFTYLQEVMAGWIGCDLGTFTHGASSLHAYVQALRDFANEPSEVVLPAGCDIRMPRPEADSAWDGLSRLARELMARSPRSAPSISRPRVANGLGPIESMYWLLVAEDARRKGWSEEMLEAQSNCRDALLLTMWVRWLQRVLPMKAD